MLKKTLTTGLALGLATAASAGGFADEIIEAPVIIVEPEAAAGSIPGWVIPAAVVALLVALAASSGSDGEEGGGGEGSLGGSSGADTIQ